MPNSPRQVLSRSRVAAVHHWQQRLMPLRIIGEAAGIHN
jgi:hypothetical protein